MSFNKVEELAQASFTIENNDSRRLVGAVEYALQQHTAKDHTVATQLALKPL
jgi:hypothetical protein